MSEENKEVEQTEVAATATAAAMPADVYIDKSVYEQINKRKKGKNRCYYINFCGRSYFSLLSYIGDLVQLSF